MNINCEVIGDLLPLYAENMASAASRAIVDEHLAGCESCREKLAHMGESLPVPIEQNREEVKPLKKFRFHLLIAILGFPLWFPLLAAVLVILLVLYLCVWVVVVSLWSVPVALGASALALWLAGGISLLRGGFGALLFYGGCGLACAGLTILSFMLMKRFTAAVGKGTVWIFRKIGGRKHG